MSRPNKTLQDCDNDEYLAAQRCAAILENVAPGRVKCSKGQFYLVLAAGEPAERIYLNPGENVRSIEMRIYPGDTVKQANSFFGRVRKGDFLWLLNNGWELTPNLHFSYIGTYTCQVNGNEIDLEDFFDFWAREEIRQVRRRDPNTFPDLFRHLREHHLISGEDQLFLHERFSATKRDHINVCPGFKMIFAWKRASANKLDRECRLAEAVHAKANEALITWGQYL